MGEYSVRDKAWNWPEKWRRWKVDFARSERVPEPWEAALLRWDGEADLEPQVLAGLAAWDWEQYKFDQLSELRECTFWLREYRSPSADWDHDHCLDAGRNSWRLAIVERRTFCTKAMLLTKRGTFRRKPGYRRREGPKREEPMIEPLEDGMAAEWSAKVASTSSGKRLDLSRGTVTTYDVRTRAAAEFGIWTLNRRAERASGHRVRAGRFETARDDARDPSLRSR